MAALAEDLRTLHRAKVWAALSDAEGSITAAARALSVAVPTLGAWIGPTGRYPDLGPTARALRRASGLGATGRPPGKIVPAPGRDREGLARAWQAAGGGSRGTLARCAGFAQ